MEYGHIYQLETIVARGGCNPPLFSRWEASSWAKKLKSQAGAKCFGGGNRGDVWEMDGWMDGWVWLIFVGSLLLLKKMNPEILQVWLSLTLLRPFSVLISVAKKGRCIYIYIHIYIYTYCMRICKITYF